MPKKWYAVEEGHLPTKGERVIGYDIYYDRIGEAVLASQGQSLEFIDSDDCLIMLWTPMPDVPVYLRDRELRRVSMHKEAEIDRVLSTQEAHGDH